MKGDYLKILELSRFNPNRISINSRYYDGDFDNYLDEWEKK